MYRKKACELHRTCEGDGPRLTTQDGPWWPGMESLVAGTLHTVSRSCFIAVAGICRRVGGLFSSSMCRSYADLRLVGLVPPSPEVSSADSPLSGEFPSLVPKTQKFVAVRPIYDNAHSPRKCEGFRVGVAIGVLKPQLGWPALNGEGIPVGIYRHVSNSVTQASDHEFPRPGFIREMLPIGCARGVGNIHVSKAVAILKDRQQQGIIIDSYSFVDVLKRCSNYKDVIATRQVHDCIVQSGMDKNPYVVNTLLNVYVRCGRLQDARRLFDGLEKKDNFTWSTLIGGYAKNKHAEDALELFNQMRQAGMQPGEFLCMSILNACASPSALKGGKEIHAYIRRAGMESDARVGTALVQMYALCGCISEATRVFEKLINRDVITWNAMIGAYAKRGFGVEAYQLFLHMQREGFKPNAITYMSILNASASAGALEWVKDVHGHARIGGLDTDLRVGGALVHMYAKCGSIVDARLMFEKLKARDVRTWTIMIGAYADSSCGAEAYRLFLEMQREGFKPDGHTYARILNGSAGEGALEWVRKVHRHALRMGLESDLRVGNALVQGYAKSGKIGDSRVVFDRLKRRDVTTWNIMIGAYAESGFGVEAHGLFLQMQRAGFKPNAITYMSILNASASAGALEWVKDVHGHVRRAGLESDLRLGTSLVHMYAKCGSLDDARQVFDRMEKRDIFTWTAMIGGLAQHGRGREALQHFRRMNVDGVKPNETSFVAVLSACCHSGLVDDGLRLFLAMTEEYGIEPTIVHYNCMVDLLGRAGQLEKAKGFIDDMRVQPDGVTWRALLGACRAYGNVELGEFAAKEVFKLEPKDAAAYVVLSNIYAAAGNWEMVSSVRMMMQKRGVRKEPGFSWIEVDNKIHEFIVGDTSHPDAKAIYTVLKELTEKLKAEGYVPDTTVVLQNIHEEDKELALCSHSEKLAIAYGLLRIPRGQPILVYKNLRVCSDCHTATKFISKVTGRDIIARDANRFHHFKDGVCSCGDYW